MLPAGTGRGIQRLYGRRQFAVGVFVAIGGEKEFLVADIAAPATELGGFVMTQGNPEGVVGQLMQTLSVDVGRGGQRGADTERQPGKAFEHSEQLKTKVTKTQRGRPKGPGSKIKPAPQRERDGSSLSLSGVLGQTRI